MAYSRTQLLEKYKTIRDAIIDDMATNVGETLRIRSYSIAGRSFSYSTSQERSQLLKYIEGRITELSASGMFRLARFADL
jgi:hypothetical protein